MRGQDDEKRGTSLAGWTSAAVVGGLIGIYSGVIVTFTGICLLTTGIKIGAAMGTVAGSVLYHTSDDETRQDIDTLVEIDKQEKVGIYSANGQWY